MRRRRPFMSAYQATISLSLRITGRARNRVILRTEVMESKIELTTQAEMVYSIGRRNFALVVCMSQVGATDDLGRKRTPHKRCGELFVIRVAVSESCI